MIFDLQKLAPRERYKLLIGSVVPRPIALVTSLNENGGVNAAPFSFFNVVGSDPPLVMIAPGNRDADTPKDTARNIRQNREFVVNLVDEDLAEAMNICATDFPPDWSEIEAANLEIVPAQTIKVPRLAASPVALECREHSTLEIGNNRLILGEVLAIFIRDELVDAEKFYVATANLHLIGRMGGAGGYTKTRATFEIGRLNFEEWEKTHAKTLRRKD